MTESQPAARQKAAIRKAMGRKMHDRVLRSSAFVKVCDDTNGRTGPTVWKYDAQEKTYIRFDQKGNILGAIRGESLPDPETLKKTRADAFAAVLKHVRAEDIERLAGIAVEKGKDPSKFIAARLQGKTAPAKATQDLWDHWQTVKSANGDNGG